MQSRGVAKGGWSGGEKIKIIALSKRKTKKGERKEKKDQPGETAQ